MIHVWWGASEKDNKPWSHTVEIYPSCLRKLEQFFKLWMLVHSWTIWSLILYYNIWTPSATWFYVRGGLILLSLLVRSCKLNLCVYCGNKRDTCQIDWKTVNLCSNGEAVMHVNMNILITMACNCLLEYDKLFAKPLSLSEQSCYFRKVWRGPWIIQVPFKRIYMPRLSCKAQLLKVVFKIVNLFTFIN